MLWNLLLEIGEH